MEERHQEILNILEREGRIKATDIQELFQVGLDTARRDLRILESKGLLRRTHGGALPTIQRGFTTPPMYTPRNITEIKENYWAIAIEAVSLIKRNDVIFITEASVGFFMAQNLPRNIPITVATNSIIIADEIRNYDNVTTILIGGEMSQRGLCRDGFAIEFVKNLRFDTCFITSGGISSDFGLSINTFAGAAFIKAVIQSSKRKIGLFPTEKIGVESIMKICPVTSLDTIITDWDALKDELFKIEKKGVELVVVEQK